MASKSGKLTSEHFKTWMEKVFFPNGGSNSVLLIDSWKNFVERFSDSVILLDFDINLHLRNNIIKLQSLMHNQLSSLRYSNLFKYSWHKSNYVSKKPEHFENHVTFGFSESQTHCEISGCNNVAIIRCSWCKKSLCLKHFFD